MSRQIYSNITGYIVLAASFLTFGRPSPELLPLVTPLLSTLGLPPVAVAVPDQDIKRKNYLGATIFIAYILAALALTASICSTLIRKYGDLPAYKKQGRYFKLKFLVTTGFAVLSFVLLSYNMLMFLVSSYQTWSDVYLKLSAENERTVAFNHTYFGILHRVWKWAVTSHLFEEFARELNRDPRGWWWVERSLLLTLMLFGQMGVKRRVFQTQSFWRYVALAEILPSLFSWSLLQLDTIFQNTPQAISSKNASKGKKRENTHYVIYLNRDVTVFVTFLLLSYKLCLIALCGHASDNALMPLIFALRSLLIFATLTPRNTEVILSNMLAGVMLFVISSSAMELYRQPELIGAWFSAEKKYYAVRALGCDTMLLVGWFVWWIGAYYTGLTSHDVDEMAAVTSKQE